MSEPPGTPAPGRRTGIALVLLAALPPAIALLGSMFDAPHAPEPLAERTARGDLAAHYTWPGVIGIPDVPNLVLYRAAYLGLLSLPSADFGSFAFVNVLVCLA